MNSPKTVENDYLSTPTLSYATADTQDSRALGLDLESLQSYAVSLEKNLKNRDREIARLKQQSKASYWIDRIAQAERQKDEQAAAAKLLLEELKQAEDEEFSIFEDMAAKEETMRKEVLALSQELADVKAHQSLLKELLTEKEGMIQELHDTINFQQREIIAVKDEAACEVQQLREEVMAARGVQSPSGMTDDGKSPAVSSKDSKIKELEGDLAKARHTIAEQQIELLKTEGQLIELKETTRLLELQKDDLEANISNKETEIEQFRYLVESSKIQNSIDVEKVHQKDAKKLHELEDEVQFLNKILECYQITPPKRDMPDQTMVNLKQKATFIPKSPESALDSLISQRACTPQVRVHTPVSQDSLSKLSMDYHLSWNQDLEANNHSKDESQDRLYPSPLFMKTASQCYVAKEMLLFSPAPLRVPNIPHLQLEKLEKQGQNSTAQQRKKASSVFQRCCHLSCYFPIGLCISVVFYILYLLGLFQPKSQRIIVEKDGEDSKTLPITESTRFPPSISSKRSSMIDFTNRSTRADTE